jgi:hypothetical protein
MVRWLQMPARRRAAASASRQARGSLPPSRVVATTAVPVLLQADGRHAY